jgi:hypothetical protein
VPTRLKRLCENSNVSHSHLCLSQVAMDSRRLPNRFNGFPVLNAAEHR